MEIQPDGEVHRMYEMTEVQASYTWVIKFKDKNMAYAPGCYEVSNFALVLYALGLLKL